MVAEMNGRYNPNLPLANDQVIALVRDYLQNSDLHRTCGDFCESIGVPSTTVQFRLKQGGTCWRTLVREEKSRRLELILQEPGKLDPGDAAERLGFAETTTFYMFFSSTMGETYTAYRQRTLCNF
jgi:AraC-like DNA-binding protein